MYKDYGCNVNPGDARILWIPNQGIGLMSLFLLSEVVCYEFGGVCVLGWMYLACIVSE